MHDSGIIHGNLEIVRLPFFFRYPTKHLFRHRIIYWSISTELLVLGGLGQLSSPLEVTLPGRKSMQGYRSMVPHQSLYVSIFLNPEYEQPRRVMFMRLRCSLGR